VKRHRRKSVVRVGGRQLHRGGDGRCAFHRKERHAAEYLLTEPPTAMELLYYLSCGSLYHGATSGRERVVIGNCPSLGVRRVCRKDDGNLIAIGGGMSAFTNEV
jgi:hypothetical protein